MTTREHLAWNDMPMISGTQITPINGALGVAKANTTVGVSSETFLLLQKKNSTSGKEHSRIACTQAVQRFNPVCAALASTTFNLQHFASTGQSMIEELSRAHDQTARFDQQPPQRGVSSCTHHARLLVFPLFRNNR
jgi:hypothetical protein